MLQLLSPFWLVSLAGLAIPLAIHLWNKRKGRVIKIGSIALLQEAQSKRMSQIRISEVGLLLLRCAILTLLTLWLAQPQWLIPSTTKPKTWILLSPELVGEVTQNVALKNTLDTLLKQATELHLLANGFPVLKRDQLHTNNQSTRSTLNYWSLLREASQLLSAGASIYVLTGESLNALQGKRPVLPIEVKWLTFPEPDTSAKWLAGAYQQADGTIRVTSGESRAEGTQYSAFKSLPNQPQSADFQITNIGGLPQVQLAKKPSETFSVDTTTLRIGIYADKSTQSDVAYLEAALQAIKQYSQRKIRIETALTKQTETVRFSCIFWLSQQPIPQSLQKQISQGGWLFRYAEGKYQPMDTWLQLPTPGSTPVHLFQSIAAASDSEFPVWTDGYGRPIVTRTTTGTGEVLSFFSRFHPSWNDLVWNETFPQTLYELLQKDLFAKQGEKTQSVDLRRVDPRQLLPTYVHSSNVQPIAEEPYSLREYLWILALLLFGVERWWSERSTKNNTAKIKSVA